jgi:hypothetical protein
MRTLLLVLSLLGSMGVAAAEYEYVVPLAGYTEGSGRTWYYAQAFIQNLTPRPATLRVTGIYPATPDARCALSETATIEAHEQIVTGLSICRAQFAAFSFVSNEKLNIRVEIDSHVTRRSGWDKQLIDATSGWLPAGVDAVAEGIANRSAQRTNILLVNPSDRVLTVQVNVTRPEFGVSQDLLIEVAPKATRLFPIAEIANPAPWPFPTSVDGRHYVRLRGDGPLQGGVTTVDTGGASMYVPLVALEP